MRRGIVTSALAIVASLGSVAHASGVPAGGNKRMTSPSYNMTGGVVGATQGTNP